MSRASGRDKSTLTPIVAELSRLGLIIREDCESDGRSRKLYLTPDGRKHLEELERHAAAHDALLDKLVGADDKPLLLELLGKILNILDNDAPTSGAA